MFPVALLTIGRTRKQPKCPAIGEWTKKLWYIYRMEYYSTIKRNETGSFVETWMDLQSLRVKLEKQISCINAYVWNLEKWYR